MIKVIYESLNTYVSKMKRKKQVSRSKVNEQRKRTNIVHHQCNVLIAYMWGFPPGVSGNSFRNITPPLSSFESVKLPETKQNTQANLRNS